MKSSELIEYHEMVRKNTIDSIMFLHEAASVGDNNLIFKEPIRVFINTNECLVTRLED